MAGSEPETPSPRQPQSIRLAIPKSHLIESLEPEVEKAFARAIEHLKKAGISVTEIDYPELREIPAHNAKGGIVVVEAYAHHRRQLESGADAYDPRVSRRILAGSQISAADFLDIVAARRRLIRHNAEIMAGLDALVLPTTPNIPPLMEALARDEDYMRLNALSLRNTSVGNFLDQCAISLPMNASGAPPTGLMLMAPHGRDRQMFAVALGVEAVLAGLRSR
jgi:aspartyl-tRNA(Asn)/glutamyl-tRNA(Gln) amidotransferase subunit A